MALDGAKFICLSDAAAEDAATNETTPSTADAGKVAGNSAEATSAEQNTVIEAKGRKFTVGYYMSCDYVLDDSRAEGVHCEIQCDAFGRVTIHNISEALPISVNGQIISLKRPLLDGSRITILDRNFLWKFPKSVEVTEGISNEDETSTPLKGVAPEQAPNSCPDLKPHRKVDKRFTVHNFAYCINSDEEGNTSTDLPSINESESVEEEATASAEEATYKKEEPEQTESEASKQRKMSTNNSSQDSIDDAKATSSEHRSITPEPQPHTSTNKLAASTPIPTLEDTPKSNLINCTQNKENKSSEKNRRLISLCQQSDVVITSFSPRETGVRIEKSFTAIFKPIAAAAAATTPKSVYSTPKSLISDYNDENSRDFIDFTTPATSKKAFGARALARNSSMHLIDLTTPNKLAPASTRARNTGATALKRNQTLPTNVKLSTTPLIYEKLEVEDVIEQGIKALPVTPKVDVTSTDTSTPQSAESVISVDGSSSDSSTTPVIEISTEDSATPSISSPVRTNIKPPTKTPQRAVVTGQKQQLTSTPQRTQTPSLMKRALLTSAKKNANPTNRASPARPHTPSTPIARNTAAAATSSTPKSSGRLAIGSPSSVAAAQRRSLSVKPRLSLAAIDSCSPAVRKGAAITTSTPLNPRHAQARNVAASAPRLSMVKRTSPLRGVRKSIGGVTLNSHISKARRSVVSPKKRSPTAIVAQHVSKARKTLCIANANKSQIASRSRSLVAAAVSAGSSKTQHGIGEKTKLAHAPPKTSTTTPETDLSPTFTKEDDESFKELPAEEKNITAAVEGQAKNITFSPIKQNTTQAETTQQELNKTFSPEKVVKELEEVIEIKQEDLSADVLNEAIDQERKAESFAKVVECNEKSAGVEVTKATVTIVPEPPQQSLEISTSALAPEETIDAVQESIQNENSHTNTEVIDTEENKKTPTDQVEDDEAQLNENVSTAQVAVNDEVVSSSVLDTQPENKTADELPPTDVEAVAAKPTGESQGTADLLEEIEYVLNKSDELKQQLSDKEAHNTSDTKELQNNETVTKGGITVEEIAKVVNLESTEQNNMNGDDVDCLPATASATELPSASKIIFSVKSNLEQKEEEDDKTSIDSDVLEATFDIGASSDIDAGSMKTEILSITTNTTPSEFEVSSFGGSSVEKDFTSEKSTVTLDAEENVKQRTDIELEKTTTTDLANSKSTTVEEAESTTGEVESTAPKRNVSKAPDSTKKTENNEIVEEKEAAETEKEAIETLDIKETQTKLQETADKNQAVAAELHKVAQPEEAVIEPLTIDESFAMDAKVNTTDAEEILEEANIEPEVPAKEASNSGSKKVDEANSKSAKDETTLQVTLTTTEVGESKPIEVETTGVDKPINSDDEKENRKVITTEMTNTSTIIVADSKATALEPKSPNLTGIRDMLRTPKQHSVRVAPITPRSIGLRSLMRTPKASTSAAAAGVTTIAEGDDDDDDEEELVSELHILPKTPQQSKKRAQTPQSRVEVANNVTPRRSARRRASANPDLTPTRCLTPTLDTNTDVSTPRRTSRRRASASAEVSYTPQRITRRRSSLSLDNEEAIAAALTPQKRGGSGLRAKRTTSTLILECAAAEDMGAIIEEEPKEDAQELNDSKQNKEDVKDTKTVDLKSIVPSISDVIEESICEEINTQKGQPNEPKDNLIEEEKLEGDKRALSNIEVTKQSKEESGDNAQTAAESSVSMPPAKLKEVENVDKEEQERDLAENPIIDAQEIDVTAAEIKDTIEPFKPESEGLTTDEDGQKIESKVLDKSDYEYGKEVAQEGADISTLEEQPKTPKTQRKSVRIVDNALNSPKTPVMVGMRELMKTPKTTDHTPKLIGVRDLMRTPKVATGLTCTDDADGEANFTGLADLVKTPKVDKVTGQNGNKEIVEKNAKDNEKHEEPSTSTEARTAFIGMRELLKTPKHTSTPQYRGMRELLRTPKACSTPQLGGLEELMQTPKRTKLNDKYEDDDDDDDNEGLDQFFKTPRAKHVMIPGDPASAILEPSTDASSLNIMTATTEYDLHSSHHRALEDIYKTPVSSRLSDVDTLTEYDVESDANQKKDEDSEMIVPETPAQTITSTTTNRNIAAEEAFDVLVDEQTPQKVITRKSQLASGMATASLLSPFSATDVITDLPKTDIQEWVDNLQQSDELDVEAEEEREVSVSTSILNAAKDATHDPIAASVCETSNLTVNKDTTEQMLADMSAITTSDDPLLPSAAKHATADNENETLRPATPNEADISGINLLDQTNESVFSEPLVVSDIESLHSQENEEVENEQIIAKESSTDRQYIMSEVTENKSQDEEEFPTMFVESSESEHEDDGVVTKTATEIADTTPAQKVTESQEKTIAENKNQNDTVIIDPDDFNTDKPVQSATTSSTTQSTKDSDIHIEFSNFQAHKTIASQQLRASTPNRSTKARTTKHEQARRRQSMGAEKQISGITIDLTEEKSRLVKEKMHHTATADCIIEVDESIEESIAIENVTKDEETPAGIIENAAELNEKEAELKEEAAELKEKAAELSEKEAELNEKEAELKEAAELKEKEAELKDEAAELKEKAAELSEHIDDLKEAELKEKAAELNQNAAELSETVSKLDEKVDELKENANEAELSKNVPELTENAAELHENTAELNDNAAELNEDAAELNEDAAELNENAAELNESVNTNAAKLPSKSQETKALSTEQIREEFGNFQAHKTIASREKRAATPDQVNKKMAHKISQAPRRLTLGAEQHLTAVNIDFVKETSQSRQSKQLPECIIEIDDSIEETADEQVSAPQFKQSDVDTSEGTAVIMVEMTKTNTTLKANKEIVEETQKELATQETLSLDNASELQNTTEAILEASATEDNIEKVVEHHIPEEPATKVTESIVKEKTSEVALSTQTATAKNDSPTAAKTEFNESDIFDLTEEVPNEQPAVNTTQGVIFDLTGEEEQNAEVKKVQKNEKCDAEENIFEVTDNEENHTQSQSESSNDRRVECQSDAISSTEHDTATAAIQLEKAEESGNDVPMVASNDEVKADSTNEINDVAHDKSIGDKTAADLQKEGNEELVLKTSMVSEEDNIDISESINKMSQAKVDDINIALTEGSNKVDKDNANDKETNVPLPDKAEESDQITAEPPALLLQDSVNELDTDVEEITAENKIATSMEADTTLSVNESDQGKVAETENEAPTNVEQIKEVIDEDTQKSNKVAVEANAEMQFEVQISAQEVVDEMNIVKEKQNEEKEVHGQTPANENCLDVEEVNKSASSSKKQTPAKRSQRKPSHTKQLNEQAETAIVNEVIVEESERNLDKVEENTKSHLLTPLKEQTTENTTTTDAELVGNSEELTVTAEGVPAITKEIPQTLEDKSVSSSDDISTISEGKLANTEEGNAKTEEQPAKSEEKLDSSESGNASSENVIVSSTELPSSVDKKPASSEQDVISNAEEVARIAEEKTARTEDVLTKTDENIDTKEMKAAASSSSVDEEQPAKRSKRKTSRSMQSTDENKEMVSKATIETEVIVEELEEGVVISNADKKPASSEEIRSNVEEVTPEDGPAQTDENVDKVEEKATSSTASVQKEQPAKRSKRKTSQSNRSTDENAEIICKATIETEVIVEESATAQENSDELITKGNIPEKKRADESDEKLALVEENMTVEDDQNVDTEPETTAVVEVETKEVSEKEKQQAAKRSKRKTSRSKQSTDEDKEAVKTTIKSDLIIEESETVEEESEECITKEKNVEESTKISNKEISTVSPQTVDEINEATTSDEKQPAGKRKVRKPSRTKQTEVEEDKNEKNTTYENKTLVEEVITTQENQVAVTETQTTVDEEEKQEPAKRSKRKTSRSKQTTVENKETDSKAAIETNVIEESEAIEKSHEPITEEKTSELNVKVTTKVSNEEISTVPPQAVDELSEATTSDEKQPAGKRKVRKPSRTKQTAVEVDASEEKTANENKSSVQEKTIAPPENQDAETETLTTVLAEAVETETTTEKELKLPEKRTVRKTSRSKQKVEQKEEETATATVEETTHLETVTEVPIEDTEIAKPLTTKLDDEAVAKIAEEQLTDATTEKIEESVELTTSVPAKRKGRKPSRTKQIAEEKLLKDNRVLVEEHERDAEKASVDVDAKAAPIAEQANAVDVVEAESSKVPSTLHVEATYEVCLLTDSKKSNKSATANKTSELVLSSKSGKESTADKAKLPADQASDTASNVVDEAESTDKQEEEAHTQRSSRRTRKGSATSQCSTQDEDQLPTTTTKRRAGRRRAETPIENSAEEASHAHDEAPTTTKRRRGQAKAAPEISQLEEIKEVLVDDSEQVKEQVDENEKKVHEKNETEKERNEKQENVTEEGTEQANLQLAAEAPQSVEIKEDVSETKPEVSAAKVSKTEISDEVKEVVATAETANAAEQEIKDGNSEESKAKSKAPTRRGGRRKPNVSESSPTSNSSEHVEVNAMQRGRRRRKPTTEEPAVSAGETKTTPTAEASEEILPTVQNKISEDKSTEKCSDIRDVKAVKAEMKKEAVEEPHSSSSSSKSATKRALKEKKEEAPVIPAITIESPEEVGDLKSESQKENIAVTEKEQPDEESTSAGRKRANRRNKAEASEEPQTENDDDTTHHKEKEKAVHTKTRKVVEESTSTPTAADSVGGRRGRRGAAAAATVAINEVASAHKRGTPRAKSQQNTSQSQTTQHEEATKKTNTAQREETTKKPNNAEAAVSPREVEQPQKVARRKRRGSATVGDTEKEQQHESEDEPTTTKKVTKSARKRHESLHTTEAEDTHAEDTSATKQRSRRKRKNSLQSVNNDEVTTAAIGSAGDAGNDEPPKKQPLSRKRRDSSLDSSIHESAAAADVDGGDNKASGGNTSSASTTPNRSRNLPRRAVTAEERNYDESSDAEAQVELKRRIEKASLPKGSSSAAAAAATKSKEAGMTTTSKPEVKDKSARNTPILAAVLTTSRGGRQRKPTARVQQYLEEERAKAETPKKRLLLSSAGGGSGAETPSTSQIRSTPAKRTRKASAVESETSEAPHTPARGGRARNLKKVASTATETSEESRSEVDHLHSEHEATTQSTTVAEEKAATSKVGKRVATRRGKEVVSAAAAPTESESEAPSATTTQTVHAGRSGRAAKASATVALITDEQTPSSSQTKPRGVGAKRARRGAHADTAATDDEKHTDVETKDAEDEKKSKKTTKTTTDGGAAAGRVARAGRGGRRKNSVDDSATSSGGTKQQALVIDADDEHEEEDDDVILMNYVDHEEDNNEDEDKPIEKVKKTTAATKKRTATVGGGSAASVTESPAPKRVRRRGGDEKDAPATQTDTAAEGSRKAARFVAESGSSGTTAAPPATRATRSRRK